MIPENRDNEKEKESQRFKKKVSVQAYAKNENI